MTTRREHHWSNRLRRVESPSTAADTRGVGLRHHPNRAKRPTQPQCQGAFPAGSKRKLEVEYDWRGRRIKKISHSAWNGSSYAKVATTKFIYDGWNLMAELDSSNNVIRGSVWGTDLSGTMQGAGGVGGLLMVKESDGTPHFVAYDGNGNVMGLVKGTDGTRTATYEYDPFGQPLRATGTMATANPMRFSTKFTDNETGLLYYGYRYYNPSTGRWLSRDKKQEKGGLNLYAFLGNKPPVSVDPFGLEEFEWPSQELSVFTAWYYHKGEASFDLISQGFMPAIQRVFRRDIEEWRRIATQRAKEEAMFLAQYRCSRSSGEILKQHLRQRRSGKPVNKILDPGLGFILGNTTLMRGYELDLEVICCYCAYNFSGTLFSPSGIVSKTQ